MIFDIRRHENPTLRLAELAREREAKVILFSDQWQSPLAECAGIVFQDRTAAPSAWDWKLATMLLVEIVIAEVQQHNRTTTKARMDSLEEMFDRTQFFRKFQHTTGLRPDAPSGRGPVRPSAEAGLLGNRGELPADPS